MAIQDNGDGTFTTPEGVRIAYPFGYQQQDPYAQAPLQPSPEIMADAARGPDMRMAGPGAPPPDVRPPLDPGVIAGFSQQDRVNAFAQEQIRKAREANPGAFSHGGASPAAGDRKSELGAMLDKPLPKEAAAAADERVPRDERVQVGQRGATGGGPAFAPARVIPGGLALAGQTTQKGTPLPRELKDQFEQNVLTHRAANEVGRQAAEHEGAAAADAASAYAADADRRAAEEEARVARHQQAMADATGKLDTMSQEYRSQPVNEDSYWQERGSGARILSALIVGLGEVGAGMSGRQNTAKTIIDKQIDTWIADRRERRRAAVEDQRSLVGQARANFESESAQNAALRAQAYDAYRAKLGAISASFSGEKEQANTVKLDADLADKSLDWKTRAAQFEADHVTTQERMTAPTVVGGAPRMAAQNRGLVVESLDGRKYLARSEKASEDLHTKLSLARQGIDALDTMHRIANKSAGEKLDPNSPIGQEFAYAQEIFANTNNQLQEQNMLKGEDLKRFQEYTGSKWGLATAPALRQLRATLARSYAHNLESKADTKSELSEEFEQDQRTGVIDKVARYKTFDDGRGGKVPVAFTPAGAGHKKGRK